MSVGNIYTCNICGGQLGTVDAVTGEMITGFGITWRDHPHMARALMGDALVHLCDGCATAIANLENKNDDRT